VSPHEHEIVWTVVVAGGSGARFGSAKQYAMIGSRRMLDIAVTVAAGASRGVVVVVPAADVVVEAERAAAPQTGQPSGTVSFVAGGSTRSESVRAGLAAVPADATVICVHDAARPFATSELYAAVVGAVHAGADGAIPGLAVTDTIKIVDARRVVVDTPDRAGLVAVQTPQAFRADVLRRAHADGGDGTDDAALVERVGGTVIVLDGSTDNRKITHPDDLAWAQRVQTRQTRQTVHSEGTR
jgi:2-C-methyl-D-erythritol 4-phosphate cytidylyltransferase